MITLRQFLAFPMFLAAIWLVWVLAQQTGANGVGLALLGTFCLALIIWLWHHTPMRRATRAARIALMVIAGIGLIFVTTAQNDQAIITVKSSGAEQAFTKAGFDAALKTDRPVFVNMTAAWCITCKVNERLALTTDATRDLFTAQNILYIKGDWTNYDADITKFLAAYGRQGVPLYIFIGAPDKDGKRPDPVILPQLLTPSILRDTIRP
jgi:thiol:disulfide interchange protein